MCVLSLKCLNTHWLPAECFGLVNKVVLAHEWQWHWTAYVTAVLPILRWMCTFSMTLFSTGTQLGRLLYNFPLCIDGFFCCFFKPKPLIFKCILTWAFNVFQQNYSGVCCHWITSFCILGTCNLRVFLITENTSSHLTTCKKTQPKFHCQQLATVWLQCCEHWFYWVWILNQKEILFPVIKKKKKIIILSVPCVCLPKCMCTFLCV